MTSLDLAAEMMAEQHLEEGDDRAGLQLTAIDQAVRLLTPQTAQYDGTSRGTSLGSFLRLAGVVPQVVGPGILTAMADVGIRDPGNRYIKAGRFAANDDDCFELFFAQRPYADHYGWANDPATGYYVQRELKVEVPCPANVSTLLIGFAAVDIKTATTSSSVASRFVLGDGPETYGDPLPRNLGGKLGPVTYRTGGDRPGLLSNLHARTVVPAGERGSSVKQACSFRLQSDTSAPGCTIGTAWMVIARVPV